jgi:hypothetical protein
MKLATCRPNYSLIAENMFHIFNHQEWLIINLHFSLTTESIVKNSEEWCSCICIMQCVMRIPITLDAVDHYDWNFIGNSKLNNISGRLQPV